MLIFDLILATRRAEMSGVERYGVNLFTAVRKRRPDTIAFVHDASHFSDREGLLPVGNIYAGWLSLPLLIHRLRLAPESVIFPTAPASPLFHATALNLCRIVHDDFPWRRDTVMPLKGRLLYRHVENLMAKRYDRLLGTTVLVARDLRARIDRDDINACGNAPGIDLSGPENAPSNAPQNFILAVGTVEPRKNYQRIVELVESAGATDLPMVLVGRPGWGRIVQSIERLAASRPDSFVWLRDLDDAGLRWLYRRAACFLSLSQAEGFNMPLVESAMCGRPLVCSDIEVHRSVAPPWARFVGSDVRPESLWRELAKATSAPPSPDEVAAYARRYGWDQIATQILQSADDGERANARSTGCVLQDQTKAW